MENGDRRAARFLIVVLAILLFASAVVVWPFRTGIAFALLLGFLLHPLYRRLVRAVRLRPLAAAIVLLLTAIALVLPLAYITWRIAQEAIAVSTGMSGSGMRETAVNALGSFGVSRENAATVLNEGLAALGRALQSLLLPTLTTVFSIVTGLLVFFMLLYFTLVGGEDLAAYLRRVMPLPRARAERLMQLAGERIRALMLGNILVSVIQGVAAGLGWWFFGFPAPVFWGFVMTILAILPAAAPFLVLVPAGILAILQGDLYAGVGILVWAAAVVGLIDNLARPFVLGKRADVHPGIVLVGTLGGLVVFGPTGFILGPLLLSLVPVVLDEFRAMSPPDERTESRI